MARTDEIESIDLNQMMTELARDNIELKMPRPALITNVSPASKDKKDEAKDPDIFLVTLTSYMTKADLMSVIAKSKNGVVMIEL